jgi:hypothetical protein
MKSILPTASQIIVLAIMASANEFVSSLISGEFDHSASKIHGQGAIIHT